MKKLLLFFSHIIIITLNGSAQPSLLGMTSEGGDGFGTIFKTDSSGNNLQVLSTFSPNMPGENPIYAQLCEATNGKLYGMTRVGGSNGAGVIFEYNIFSNSYTKKSEFGGANGENPSGSLMKASNGKLYGITYSGGANKCGVIFEYDYSANLYIKKIDLDSVNGKTPYGSLMEAGNGKLYGMTSYGGTNNSGVIFEYNYTTNTYTKKIDLSSANGENPFGALIEASNNKLYGVTSYGGANNSGVIFEYDYATNTFTKKIDLSYSNGESPYGSLMQASNGKLYGLTYAGGTDGAGALFEYDYIGNAYSKKVDFISNSTDGRYPMGSLIEVSVGKLYGMASGNNPNNAGVIFEYDFSNNIYTKKIDLSSASGKNPDGTLMLASNGKLYGVTVSGGANDVGVLFEYDKGTNVYTKKIDLGSISGSHPHGSLMQAPKGKLYGTTYRGGANGAGVIFEYDYYTRSYTKKIDLSTANGSGPTGNLILVSNGKLYGMTRFGGLNAGGVIFEYDYKTNTYLKKIDLSNALGKGPTGSFFHAPNGKLYGMTCNGGAYALGVIFEYDYSTNTYIKKIDLSAASGSIPMGHLVSAPNGKLYGVTRYGGANGLGVIFEYDYSSNTYTKKIDLISLSGGNPGGSLMLASNGKFYGTTSTGGVNNSGTIFEYDYTTNTYTKKFDFSNINGNNPICPLLQASSNGKLYGMTSFSGADYVGSGVLFEYDYTTSTFAKKLDFNGTNGRVPLFTHLIEVFPPTIVTSQSSDVSICVNKDTMFTIDANGVNLIYQWQVNSGSGFTNLSNNIVYSGVTTNTLVVANTVIGMNGYQYRCAVSGSYPYPDTSTSVVLTVNPLSVVNQAVSICSGDSILLGGSYQLTAGVYYDTLSVANNCNHVDITTLTINSLPSVSLLLNPDTVCVSTGSYSLSGGLPSGGSYSGSGVSGGNFSPALAGVGMHTIDYSYTDGNFCTTTNSSQIVVDVCSGIKSILDYGHIIIYPNPGNGVFIIENSFTEGMITVLDVLGNSIYSAQINQSGKTDKIQVDLSKQTKGMYFLNMQNGEKIIVKKIVIQ